MFFKYQLVIYIITLTLTEFTDSVGCFLDNGDYVISLFVFVDLTKAFDTVEYYIFGIN